MKTMFKMMDIKNSLLLGALSVFALTSCVNENDDLYKVGQSTGTLELDVDILQPISRAVTEVDNFPVYLYDAEGKLVQSWSKVSDVPEKITLSVGNYTVVSHTPGEIAKQMTSPYYNGAKDVEILKGVTSGANVVCRMENSPITVSYAEDFTEVFVSWEITIDDSEAGADSQTAISFTNTSSSTAPIYVYYGEDGVKALKVNFRGTTKDGSTVVSKQVLTKNQADTHYDNDRENFGGGDALTLVFRPVESTDGKITTITINAEVTFTETNETIDVTVVDKSNMDDPGDEPGPGDDPTPGEGDKIKITLPDPVTLSADESATADPTSGDVVMHADNGLKSVSVKVNSSSSEMMEQLAAVADEYEGVDLVNGCEVVANQNLVEFLGSLGKEITVPAEGDTDYTFPVGQFYLFLGILPGEHNFVMTVTDMDGNTKTGTVKVTITK